MATRRSRIKGIANIPQRRKTEVKPTENAAEASTSAEPEPISAKPTLGDDLSTRITEATKLVLQEPVVEPPELTVGLEDPACSGKVTVEAAASVTSEADLLPSSTAKSIAVNTDIDNAVKTPPVKSRPDLLHRRTFIKPLVNPKLLSQRPKPKVDLVKQDDAKLEATKISPAVIPDLSAPSDDSGKLQQETANISLKENLPQLNLAQPTNGVPSVQSDNIKSGSDTEYSAGPLSPTKLLSRSRIKAVPRLGHRRASVTLHGSASESEDDVRKSYKRIRTESVCSVASVTNDLQVQTEPCSPQKKEFSSVIQRKCKRTEQSRKMAEARRHFLHKFGNQTPDKQKLTMIDLIFYNPTTNPMSQKPKKPAITEDLKSEAKEVEPEKSPEPEPEKSPPDNVSIESDEENAVPAPQIKIGANGEIVIDEKSLVIENVETKKGREELQKSKLVDGDFDTGYGVFKREKRSKDWSKEETLRFYKALNTLGTDFTMMVELFPGRSRRELKMKFKKEERVNRPLVDKAVTHPVQFDITELRKEAIIDQKKAEQQSEKRTIKMKTAIKNQISYLARKTGPPPPPKHLKKIKQEKSSPEDLYSRIEKGIACVWDSGSDDESVDTSHSSSILKPTRSGRVPKPCKQFSYPEKELSMVRTRKDDDVLEENDHQPDPATALQPGSIMIVTSQTPTGEPTFKVFMVTPSQSKIPITLTQDVLNNLTQSTGNSNAEQQGILVENNVTIPAEEECNTVTPAAVNDCSEKASEISTETMEQEIWPYQEQNISIPVTGNAVLPDDNVVLCSDGKYDIKLAEEPTNPISSRDANKLVRQDVECGQ